jgi:hypothetical protein
VRKATHANRGPSAIVASAHLIVLDSRHTNGWEDARNPVALYNESCSPRIDIDEYRSNLSRELTCVNSNFQAPARILSVQGMTAFLAVARIRFEATDETGGQSVAVAVAVACFIRVTDVDGLTKSAVAARLSVKLWGARTPMKKIARVPSTLPTFLGRATDHHPSRH